MIEDSSSLDALAAALDPRLNRHDEYLDSAEAAELLRCTPQRVRRLVHERRLPVLKDGRRLLFSRAALDAYLRREAA